MFKSENFRGLQESALATSNFSSLLSFSSRSSSDVSAKVIRSKRKENRYASKTVFSFFLLNSATRVLYIKEKFSK
jgi:hypothetical protein